MELVPYLNVVAVFFIFFNLFGYSSIVPDLMFSRIERLLEKMLHSESSVEDCCVGGAVLERRANQVGSP